MVIISAIVMVWTCLEATDYGANMEAEGLTEEQIEQYYEDQYYDDMQADIDFAIMTER
tara:strand:+ start:330 stop:503 length:174 start_codon:yes stop_codon:yes gene_type:complete